MGTYVTPADVSISSSWQDHKNRNPPSKEPGTDFNTPYGTDIRMAESGVIVIVDNDNSGAEGRRLELIMDNGEVIDYLHGSKILGKFNQRVTRGQKGVFLSGASGNGSDYYYGSHVHVTRRLTPGLPYADSVDFMDAVGEPAGNGNSKPIVKDDDVAKIYQYGGQNIIIDGGSLMEVGNTLSQQTGVDGQETLNAFIASGAEVIKLPDQRSYDVIRVNLRAGRH